MTNPDKLADALRNIVNMLRDHPAMQGREYIDLGIAANNALREYDASIAPAKVEAVADGDMHRALQWVRTHCAPCSIEERAHMAAIEEAVAAYDPERVGADTVCRPGGGVTLREVTEADVAAAWDVLLITRQPVDSCACDGDMRKVLESYRARLAAKGGL